jgi:hypothetical protein
VFSPEFTAAVDKLDGLAQGGNNTARHMLGFIRPMMDAPQRSGTMQAWFTARDGATVHTLQVDNRNGGIWAPLARTVDSHSKRGQVALNGSWRDYSGMRVIAASGSALIVADDWHTIAYVVQPEPWTEK